MAVVSVFLWIRAGCISININIIIIAIMYISNIHVISLVVMMINRIFESVVRGRKCWCGCIVGGYRCE